MTQSARLKKYRAKRKRQGYGYVQAMAHRDDHEAIKQYAAQLTTLRKAAK